MKRTRAPKVKELIVRAAVVMEVPADAELVLAHNGDPVGFKLKDGTELRPLLVLEDEFGTTYNTDSDFRLLGCEVVAYRDETGVEE